MALKSAVYNPRIETVTLTPRGDGPERDAATDDRHRRDPDAEGRPIEANQGGNFVATFGNAGISP